MRTKNADKQQEDLDLPYLTAHQSEHPAAGLVLVDSQQQQQPALAQSQSQSSLVAGQLRSSQTSSKQHQELPSGADDAASLSQPANVLSSVSLSSGAQMKPSPSGQQATSAAELANQAAGGEPVQLKEESPLQPQQAAQQIDLAQLQLTIGAGGPQMQAPKPRINELKHLLKHTNSLNELPEFGVETKSEPELSQLMEQIDVWGLNIFEVHKHSQQHSLTSVMYKIFKVSARCSLAQS